MEYFITARFLFWPVKGHYLIAFDTMRRITLLFIDAIVVTLLQIQIMWQDVDGVKPTLLSQSIAVSIVNIVFNGVWLYKKINGQHRPWTKYIANAFRGGLNSLSQVDDIRDGIGG